MFVAIRDCGRCRVGEAESLELAHFAVAKIFGCSVSAVRGMWQCRAELEAVAGEHGFDLDEPLLLGTWRGAYASFDAFDCRASCRAGSPHVFYRDRFGEMVPVNVEQAVL